VAARVVVFVPRDLARTIGLGLPVEQLRVEAVAHNQPINRILAGASALVALDPQNGELADDVAECDRAVAGHHNHSSTRKARSICAVAISGAMVPILIVDRDYTHDEISSQRSPLSLQC
jgi:hypothetical protein